jgi:3-oxoacyl-(acyl-carrier-protein) synthase III
VTGTTPAVGVLGTGSYVPERLVTNEELAARIPDVTTEWIIRKTAIRGRRYAAADQATSDLAAHAAHGALESAGTTAARIDHLIVCTSTGDFPQPPTSCLVQDMIGAHGAACVDVNAVCAGFVHGLALARGLVLADPGSHVLVIGADVYSRILDFTDRRTAVLFGDGAGAVVIGAVPDGFGILDVDLSTSGAGRDLIKVRAGGSRVPTSERTVAEGGHFFTMNGRGVRDFVLDNVPPAVAKILARNGTGPSDVNCFLPHQPNGVLLDDLIAQSGLSAARTPRIVEDLGNPGSASVPIALDHAARGGQVEDGDMVLLTAFGGGMSMGTCLLRWSTPASAG